MTPHDAFEKYRHLHHLMSDPAWLPDTFFGAIMFDLWQAVKQSVGAECQPTLPGAK